MNVHLLSDRSQRELRREPPAISLCAFVTPTPEQAKQEPKRKKRQSAGPSEYVLVFDTETTTDPSQRLRFGCYQFWKGDTLIEAGFFFDPNALSVAEQELLATFARSRGLKWMTKTAFVDDVFYGLAYDLRATIVGFNLPFDLSRLAVNHGPARGKMRGGFSFQLSQDTWKARIQVKHLWGRASLIQFAALRKRRDTKGDRKKQGKIPFWRGSFVDVKTLAAALASRSFSLGSLSEFLQTQTCKAATDEHGGPLTPDYLEYAMRDTQMGLWRFVIAKGMTWRDATSETAEFLDRATLADLQKPETWPLLTTLVQIKPDDDILPVRAKYMDEQQSTIGLNYLSSDQPLWITLADCLGSKIRQCAMLLVGRSPG